MNFREYITESKKILSYVERHGKLEKIVEDLGIVSHFRFEIPMNNPFNPEDTVIKLMLVERNSWSFMIDRTRPIGESLTTKQVKNLVVKMGIDKELTKYINSFKKPSLNAQGNYKTGMSLSMLLIDSMINPGLYPGNSAKTFKALDEKKSKLDIMKIYLKGITSPAYKYERESRTINITLADPIIVYFTINAYTPAIGIRVLRQHNLDIRDAYPWTKFIQDSNLDSLVSLLPKQLKKYSKQIKTDYQYMLVHRI